MYTFRSYIWFFSSSVLFIVSCSFIMTLPFLYHLAYFSHNYLKSFLSYFTFWVSWGAHLPVCPVCSLSPLLGHFHVQIVILYYEINVGWCVPLPPPHCPILCGIALCSGLWESLSWVISHVLLLEVPGLFHKSKREFYFMFFFRKSIPRQWHIFLCVTQAGGFALETAHHSTGLQSSEQRQTSLCLGMGLPSHSRVLARSLISMWQCNTDPSLITPIFGSNIYLIVKASYYSLTVSGVKFITVSVPSLMTGTFQRGCVSWGPAQWSCSPPGTASVRCLPVARRSEPRPPATGEVSRSALAASVPALISRARLPLMFF